MSKTAKTTAEDLDTAELAAEAEHATRTMAPPVPDVTQNAGYTVRAVMPGGPAGNGLLASWWVAAERPEDGEWVTWEAYAQDSPGHEGRLAYNAGHYYDAVSGPSGLARADNRRDALADLAVRAGLARGVAVRIADAVVRCHPEHGPWDARQKRDRRLAGDLRQWAGGAS